MNNVCFQRDSIVVNAAWCHWKDKGAAVSGLNSFTRLHGL